MITPPFLVRWYGTFAIVTAFLAAQAIVFPRWPAAPHPLPGESLRTALRDARLLSPTQNPPATAPWPARRSYELSTSAPVVIPLRDGFELTVMGGSVRERFNFQTAYIARDQPSLKLRKRHFSMTPIPTASGLAQDRPAFQTCLVGGHGLDEAFGATREQLTAIADRLATGRTAALQRLIGLKPNRNYACTLISLRGPQGMPPTDHLWKQVLGLVEPVLRSKNQ